MTQPALNRTFNEIYKDLETYTSKAIYSLNRAVDKHSIISECYLYVDDKRNEIDTKEELIAYSKTFIKNNLRWSNSPFNRRELTKTNHVEIEDWMFQSDSIFDYDMIKHKIEEFQQTLSAYDKRLFNIYFNLDLRKGKEVAKYLNISVSGAYMVINECKEVEQKFRKWILNQLAEQSI